MKFSMKRFYLLAASSMCAALLSACGGGGSSASLAGVATATGSGSSATAGATSSSGSVPTQLSGVVAVGHPIASTTVTVYDKVGNTPCATGTTAQDGTFSIDTASCSVASGGDLMVVADAQGAVSNVNGSLYGVWVSGGQPFVAVTPLSSMIIAGISSAVDASVSSSVSSAGIGGGLGGVVLPGLGGVSIITPTGQSINPIVEGYLIEMGDAAYNAMLKTANDQLVSALSPMLTAQNVSTTGFDFLSTQFTANSLGEDAVLDQIVLSKGMPTEATVSLPSGSPSPLYVVSKYSGSLPLAYISGSSLDTTKIAAIS